jgi:uncharacterized repeat protein (TIGR01451 family)
MEARNIRFSHRRVARFIQWGVGLLLALGLLWNPKTVSVQSSPVPQVTLNVPAEVLIGEDFTFEVKFRNAGNQFGYGPFIDLVLDAGGANLPKGIPPCSCDGITFVKAEMVGVVGGPITLTPTSPSPITTTPCGPVSNSSVPHPLASSGILPLTVPPGGQLITLELPFGSFDPTQPEIVVEVTAHVSNFADAGTPLTISARGGFRYGTDPLNNAPPDWPILSDVISGSPPNNQQTNSTMWNQQAQTTPTVITIKKEYLGPEDETATGPNFIGFYPLQYKITVDIANGQTVNNVTVMDCLPNNMAFQGLGPVSPTTPAPTVTLPVTSAPSNPPNNCLTVTWSSLTGGPGPDGMVIFGFFIPDVDANGNPVLPPDCSPTTSINDIKAEGDWTPVDTCDTSPVHVVSDVKPNDHILADKCIAIQKKVAVFQDTGAPGPTPGDVLQYTLNFQISDFKTFGFLDVVDFLSDGQQLLLGPSPPAPTLTVTDKFGNTGGTFTLNSDLFMTPDATIKCGAVTGGTRLTFQVSQKMINLLPLIPRHAAGILTGGLASAPASNVPATGQIVFYARIQDQFSFPHPGDPFVDKDDPINNCVFISGEVRTNVNPPMIPPGTGIIAQDDSKTAIAIVTDIIKKTVYAVKRGANFICGPGFLPGNPPPCSTKPQVTPGDEVTFRIEKTIPSSDAENLTIQDWLPLPIFDVTGLTFFNSVCGIPVPGQACLETADTLHTLPVSPTFTANATTNSLTFNYGTFNDPTNTPRKIDLLFTLTVTNKPFADGLFLTNEAQECEDNTFGVRFWQVAVAQVQVREPALKITKGIVAANNPNAVFSPAPPPPGMFTPPGSAACPRFSGTISSPLPPYLNSHISNVDANDCITFAITVENTGGSDAYDVKLRDIIPLGPTDIPNCFAPDVNSLCVTDGTGTAVPFTTSPGGFGSVIITLQNPLPGLDPSNPGKNLVVITFDACIVGNIKPGCCDNRARLEYYASTPGGPNFVDAGFGGPFEDKAQICVLPKATKSIKTTSEAHTPGTPSGPPQSPEQLAIGEIVRYRLEVVVPETSSPTQYTLQDFLPVGLSYLPGSETATLISNGGLSVSNLPPVVSGGPFTCSNSGADPIFNFGTVTNTDNDPNQEFIVLEFNALVCNIPSNQNGTPLNNSFGVFVDGQQVATSNIVQAVVVEPNLALMKSVSPAAVVPGGTVNYTVTITNNGTADAFDINFTDTLPTGLTLVNPAFPVPSGCTNNSSLPGNVNVTCLQLDDGMAMQITYQATVSATTPCPLTLTNQAKVTWTSLPGPNGTTTNPTGSSTPGSSGAINGERTGVTSPLTLNDYAATASAPLTVNCPPCVDPFSLPNMVAWWPLDEPTGATVVNDLAGFNNQGTPKPGSPLGAASAPNAVAGQVGGALDFNSNLQQTGPHLEVADHPELNFGTGDFSIDAWVNVPKPPAVFIYPIVDKLVVNAAGTQGAGYALFLVSSFTTGSRLQFVMGNGGPLANYISPATPIVPFGAWTHVAVTVNRSTGTVTFYINGTAVSPMNPPPMPLGSIDTTVPLLIGESRLPGLHQAALSIDELELFKVVLGQQDIQKIFNARSSGKCKCLLVSNERITCNPDGTFTYTFTLTNLSSSTVSGINFAPPAGVTITPSSITIPPLPPNGSTTVTVTISGPGAQSGATICFFIVLVDQVKAVCRMEHCITLPKCPCVSAPSGMVFWAPLDDATGQTTVLDLAGGNNGTTKDPSGNPLNISLGAGPQVVSQLPAPNILGGQLNPVVVDPNAPPPPPTPRGALFFNRSFVEVPHSSNLNIGPNGFTITLWAHTAGGVIPLQPLLDKFDPFLFNTGYSLYLDNWNSNTNTYTLRFNLNGTIVTGPNITLSSPLSPSDWHFIAATVAPSGTVQLTVCKLGSAWPCSTTTSTVPNFTTSSPFPLWLAGERAIPLPIQPVARELALDEVEIFGRPLMSSELQSIYDAEKIGVRKCPCVPLPSGAVAWYPLDEQQGATMVNDIAPPPSSTVNNVGTPKPGPVGSGGPAPVAGIVGAGALYFYGPYVEVPLGSELNFGTGDFSIDAWIKPVYLVDANFLSLIVHKIDSSGVGYALYTLGNQAGGRELRLVMNGTTYTSSPGITSTNWHHVAVTVSRASGPPTGTFYINGAPAGTFTPVTANLDNSSPLLIGASFLTGLVGLPNVGRHEFAIDELELFKRALTPKEVQDIFNADSSGKCKPQQGQICVVKFEDLDGDGVQDPGESLLPGWMFNVTDQNNNPVGTITTSPPGTPPACLIVAAPGTYTVTEQVQSGWMPTTPNPQTVTVQPGQTVNVAFGNKRPCDLQIRKSISPNPAQSGQPVTITLTVMNVGTGACQPEPFPGTVVSDPRPSGLTFNLPVNITQSGGSANWQCSLGVPTGDLSCATPDPLPPGYSATFTFTATVTALPSSQIQNCATVINQNDINMQNNQSCVTLQVTGCVTPPSGMAAWWPLDETSGTTANDLAGFPNNGTHVNGPTPIPGMVGGALRFDGVNDHVRVPDHAELDVGTGDFTLDAWVRTMASSGVVVLVDKRSGPTPLGYSLFLANGRLGFQMANGVGSSTCAPTPTPGVACVNYVAPTTAPNVADGQWHHLAAVVDRTNATSGVRLYVDGAQVFAGAPLTGNLDNTSDLYLGVRTPAQQDGGFFPGDLDEVELIKRALTQQEIQALFQARSAGKCKGCIEGMKWNDTDGDGIKDSGEPGLSGWTIQLSGPVNQTTTTGTGGRYRFCGLPPGTYTASEMLQPLWVRTFPPPPGTHTVTLGVNQTVSNRNFGNRRVIVLPDLIVRNLRVLPPAIPRGGIAVVSFDIVNQGQGEAGPATHQVRLFIRRPGGVDIDVLLGTVTTATLAAGASQSFTVPIRLPQDVPTSAATIRVIADSGSTVNESNEENNIAEVQITITGGP